MLQMVKRMLWPHTDMMRYGIRSKTAPTYKMYLNIRCPQKAMRCEESGWQPTTTKPTMQCSILDFHVSSNMYQEA